MSNGKANWVSRRVGTRPNRRQRLSKQKMRNEPEPGRTHMYSRICGQAGGNFRKNPRPSPRQPPERMIKAVRQCRIVAPASRDLYALGSESRFGGPGGFAWRLKPSQKDHDEGKMEHFAGS